MFSKLFYRPFKSFEDLWRRRTLYGEINEFFKFQVISSDSNGYKLPFCHNWLNEYKQQHEYAKSQSMYYERHDDGEDAEAVFEFGINLIADRVPKNAKILDVGCNTGLWLQRMYDRGYSNLWGIDPQKSAVQFANLNRPHLNIKEGFFGSKKNDIECDLMFFFGSIFRIPYQSKLFEAIDRCTKKYILINGVQEAFDDFNRDLHYNLGKKGFICIEKRVVSLNTMLPIGTEGADGPLYVSDDKHSRKFRSFFLFRRVEPRSS